MKNTSTLHLKRAKLELIIRVTTVALFSLLAILASTLQGETIAIIDTGFCRSAEPSSTITIHPEFLASEIKSDYCATADSRRLHGRKVLNELLTQLNTLPKKKFEIFPIVAFDQQGYATIESFERALKRVKELKVDYLLLSVALPLEKNINPLPPLPVTTYVAAGHAERLITKDTILWPHHFDDPKMVLVGGLQHGQRDPKALYQEKTKKYMEGNSSLANARALGKILTAISSH